MGRKKTARTIAYEGNKSAKVGTEIVCPICKAKFVKRQWAQAFCCGKCKDAYWNAKKDRHRAGYYTDYDNAKPERRLRRALYSMDVVTARDGDELSARMAYETDEDFRMYLREGSYHADGGECQVDLYTEWCNYMGID